MSIFNTPVLQTIGGSEYRIPKLTLADFELLAEKIIAGKKAIIDKKAKENGYSPTDIIRLKMQADLDDFDIVMAVERFARTGSGAQAVIDLALSKMPDGKALAAVLFGGADKPAPDYLLNLAWAIVAKPEANAEPTAAKKDPAP